MKVLLVSTYELGRQPFALASAAAWLAAAGHEVDCRDLALDAMPPEAIVNAGLIAFHLPMHTATRLAVPAIESVRRLNPGAHVCCFGLYAPLNAQFLAKMHVKTVLGGEFEPGLARLAGRLDAGQPAAPDEPLISLDRLQFRVPDRSRLPPLERYAQLRHNGTATRAGYTEASRGCKHRCRHCPVVPVYNGTFRVVQPEIVLEDIRNQVAAGAGHITFGDPDFFNGPAHAVRIVEALHREFPALTYDATIKIEHLLAQRRLIPVLRDTGCLFVTSAVESLDDAVLAKLEKGHTRRDFLEVAELFRATGLALAPTFIAFTPWTTPESYKQLLAAIANLDLVDTAGTIQLALRLLIPAGSRLLELEDLRASVTGYDEAALLYRWRHPDPAVDVLAARALALAGQELPRREAFAQLWDLVQSAPWRPDADRLPRAAIPYLDEPWYC